MDITRYLAADLFEGRTVFVTGGGSGINLGVAHTFARLGANVGLCGRTIEKLETAAHALKKHGVRVSFSVADVRDAEALERALGKTRDEVGPVSVLVCGAAGNFLAPAEELSPNGFKAVVDIDLLGTFNACKAAFSQLKETQGSILMISAGQAFTPYAAQAHVGAAKAGVDNLMRNLALEWGRYGIRVNSIAPGPIEGTEGMRRLAPGAVAARLEQAIPLGRFGTVDDIGAVAAFLASPLAAYVTGTLVVADGGQNLPGSGLYTAFVMEALKGEEKAA